MTTTEKKSDVRKVKMEFSFQLTEKDIAKMGRDVARLHSKIGELEKELSEKKSVITTEVKKLRTESNEALKRIRAGKEPRMVDCDAHFNFQEGTVEYFHAGDSMQKRAMTEDERQTELRLAGERTKKTNLHTIGNAKTPLAQVMHDETKRNTKRDLSTQ